MEQLEFKREFFAAPERAFRQKPNAAILVVTDLPKTMRQLRIGRAVGLGCKFPRRCSYATRIERSNLLGGRSRDPCSPLELCSGSCRRKQKISPIQRTLPQGPP